MNTRDEALIVLMDIETNHTYSNQALANALRRNQFADKAERAFLTRLVEGVVEYRIRLDYVVDLYANTKIKKCKPLIACLLRMGCYQILFMDGVPDFSACNESVKLAKKHGFTGLSGFVNGVLRKIAANKEQIPYPDAAENAPLAYSVTYSTPPWLVNRLMRDYGAADAKKILESAFAKRPTSIRISMRCLQNHDMTKQDYRTMLADAGITVTDGAYHENVWLISGYDFVHRIPGYKKGFFTVQDESSVCAVAAAGIGESDFVMDLCAAPGGKTTAVAELATSGRVLSLDIAEEKLERIRENTDRLQLDNVEIACRDATVFMEEYREQADVVIADLPCSGLGVMGRKNDIKYRVTEAAIDELQTLQHQILQNACRYVKPGGTLLYSTCTITPEENSLQTEQFLHEHPDFTLTDSRQFLQGIDPCDGFYYAIFKKNV